MNFLNNLERKIGKRPIEHLMLYAVICYIVGYVLMYLAPSALSYLTLEPYMIIHHFQLWRLVSWIIMPPSSSLIWAIIMIYFYYQLGNALEQTWGAFRFNVFIFGGLILTIVGAFVLYFIMGQPVYIGSYFSTYYICLTIFLAFAVCYPQQQVMLWFIVPIKMKWMAIVYVILAAIDAVRMGWSTRVAIIASLVNFLIFFGLNKGYKSISPRERHRKQSFKKKVNTPPPYRGGVHPNASASAKASAKNTKNAGTSSRVISKHRCAICGQTELSNPDLEFRFCSKCNGNYEYCQNHLFTHTHIK